jgi:cytochrome c oxidase subunit 2
MLLLPPQASSMARELDTLHYSVILVTLAGATLVALIAGYFVVKYPRSRRRAREGADAGPARATRSIGLGYELGAVGLLLMLFVGWWLVGFRQFVRLQVPPSDSLVIYVTAKQWMWTFIYPDGAASNGVVYVPVGRPVKLVMSSRDVIHSFFVPAFRAKKDVIPGQVTTVWFEARMLGKYPLFCAEYCGDDHSTMRAEVSVLSPQDYAKTLEQLPTLRLAGPEYVEPALGTEAPREATSLARVGEHVAVTRGCMRCHTADGTPHIGPTWAGLFGSVVPLQGGGSALVDEAYITESMMDPELKLHARFPPLMPTYRGLLGAPETGALIEYIRALRSAPTESRSSPLAREGNSALTLPSASDRTLEVRSGGGEP